MSIFSYIYSLVQQKLFMPVKKAFDIDSRTDINTNDIKFCSLYMLVMLQPT